MDGVSQALSTAAGRDKYMAATAFGGMLLAQPLKTLGFVPAGEFVQGLGGLADGYRALTRFSGSFDAVWTSSRLNALATLPAGTTRIAAYLTFWFDALFFPLEHVAVLARHNVIANPDDRAGRFGGAAVACWFWSTLIGLACTLRDLVNETSAAGQSNKSSSDLYRSAAIRRLKLAVLRSTCFVLLALSFLPDKGVKLLAQPSGLLYPLHVLFATISPPKLQISDTVRGVLGTIAVATEFA